MRLLRYAKVVSKPSDASTSSSGSDIQREAETTMLDRVCWRLKHSPPKRAKMISQCKCTVQHSAYIAFKNNPAGVLDNAMTFPFSLFVCTCTHYIDQRLVVFLLKLALQRGYKVKNSWKRRYPKVSNNTLWSFSHTFQTRMYIRWLYWSMH